MSNAISSAFGSETLTHAHHTCGAMLTPFKVLAGKVKEYVQAHWKKILGNLIAWGAILALCGGLYGFKKVTVPMLMGAGPGLLIGLLTGILTVKMVGQKAEKKSLTGFLTTAIQHLDQNMTRPLLMGILATAFVFLAKMMPHGIGGISGAIAGHMLAIAVGTHSSEPRPPPTPTEEQQRLGLLERQAVEDQEKILRLTRTVAELQEWRQRMEDAFCPSYAPRSAENTQHT